MFRFSVWFSAPPSAHVLSPHLSRKGRGSSPRRSAPPACAPAAPALGGDGETPRLHSLHSLYSCERKERRPGIPGNTGSDHLYALSEVLKATEDQSFRQVRQVPLRLVGHLQSTVSGENAYQSWQLRIRVEFSHLHMDNAVDNGQKLKPEGNSG